jgi:hypothetical protein
VNRRATGDFFLATTKYTTRDNVYKAPEDVLEFDVRMVTVTPQGEPIAFGFARWESEDWAPTGFGRADWCRRDWYLASHEGDSET